MSRTPPSLSLELEFLVFNPSADWRKTAQATDRKIVTYDSDEGGSLQIYPREGGLLQVSPNGKVNAYFENKIQLDALRNRSREFIRDKDNESCDLDLVTYRAPGSPIPSGRITCFEKNESGLRSFRMLSMTSNVTIPLCEFVASC